MPRLDPENSIDPLIIRLFAPKRLERVGLDSLPLLIEAKNGDRFGDHGTSIFIGDFAGHDASTRHRKIDILQIIVLRYVQPLAGVASPSALDLKRICRRVDRDDVSAGGHIREFVAPLGVGRRRQNRRYPNTELYPSIVAPAQHYFGALRGLPIDGDSTRDSGRGFRGGG